MKIKINNVNDAGMINAIANKYKEFDIDCICGRYIIDLKSIMGILSLGLPKEVEIEARTDNTSAADSVYRDLERWKV